MGYRTLIAGIGNIFLGDDGFGVEVANRLSREPLPGWVRVEDFGIRGVHLAYELADGGYEVAVLVDATQQGEPPGTVYLIEPDLTKQPAGHLDAHTMTPEAVFQTAHALGGISSRVLIVGCEPAQTDEGIGLSEPVTRAVDEAVRMVRSIVEQQQGGA